MTRRHTGSALWLGVVVASACGPLIAATPPPVPPAAEAVAPPAEATPPTEMPAPVETPTAIAAAADPTAQPPAAAPVEPAGTTGGQDAETDAEIEAAGAVAGDVWMAAFDAYPGAREVRMRHVQHSDGRSYLAVYVTGDRLASVKAFYRRHHGAPENGSRWHKEEGPSRTALELLSVPAARARGYLPEDEAPPKGATVIVLESEVREEPNPRDFGFGDL